SFTWNGGDLNTLMKQIATPTEFRLQQLQLAMHLGASVEQVYEVTKIDPWFLEQVNLINQKAKEITSSGELTKQLLRSAKMMGFSDLQIATLRNVTESEIKLARNTFKYF
ncbi:MAG: hypothetical protein RL237_758, partial [Actinomycetota bacterium]